MIDVGNATFNPCDPVNNINTVDTINLSATGSKNAPNDDVTFHLRARYPSSQSVNDAAANRIEHSTLELLWRHENTLEDGDMLNFGK